MDDAADVWFHLHNISQWSGSILGDFNCHQGRYAIFYYRLGWLGFTKGGGGKESYRG